MLHSSLTNRSFLLRFFLCYLTSQFFYCAIRVYGTIKQEEIHLVGNYLDEISAREEIGRYIKHYHHSRPHRALMNFTPSYVHEVNNKSRLLAELKAMKKKTREKCKAYCEQNRNSTRLPGGAGIRLRPVAIILGQIWRPVFKINYRILKERVPQPKTIHLLKPFCLTVKKLDNPIRHALDTLPDWLPSSRAPTLVLITLSAVVTHRFLPSAIR